MTKRAKWLLTGWLLIFAAIQFIGPARTNPPVVASHTIQSQLRIPPNAADVLKRACMDCHSHETRWPWYSRAAPVRWWVVDDVNRGRAAINLSEWTTQNPRGLSELALAAMAGQVRRGSMPLASYKALHPEARLSPAEVEAFYDWARAEAQRLKALRAERKSAMRNESSGTTTTTKERDL